MKLFKSKKASQPSQNPAPDCGQVITYAGYVEKVVPKCITERPADDIPHSNDPAVQYLERMIPQTIRLLLRYCHRTASFVTQSTKAEFAAYEVWNLVKLRFFDSGEFYFTLHLPKVHGCDRMWVNAIYPRVFGESSESEEKAILRYFTVFAAFTVQQRYSRVARIVKKLLDSQEDKEVDANDNGVVWRYSIQHKTDCYGHKSAEIQFASLIHEDYN